MRYIYIYIYIYILLIFFFFFFFFLIKKIFRLFFFLGLCLTVLHNWTLMEASYTSSLSIQSSDETLDFHSPVSWGCRICQLHLCRGIRLLPMSVLDMTLKHLMVRLHSSSSGECRVPLHCHYSQVYSDQEW